MADHAHPRVVDTNVPVAANEKAGASPACVRNCVDALENIMRAGQVVIDSGWEILGEYLSNLSETGQPGAGDKFFRWVLTNQTNAARCARVIVTAKDESSFEENYVEFPDEPALRNFDPSDRKFVAVAMAHPDRPPILEATDSKWWGWRKTLEGCGVRIEFVCPDDIAKKHAEKTSP